VTNTQVIRTVFGMAAAIVQYSFVRRHLIGHALGGCLLPSSCTIRPEVLDHADALVCSVITFSMRRSTPGRIFGDFSGKNHSKPDVNACDKHSTRTSHLLIGPQGKTQFGTGLGHLIRTRRPQLRRSIPPGLSKMDENSTLAPRVLCLMASCLRVGNAGVTVLWEPWTPGPKSRVAPSGQCQ